MLVGLGDAIGFKTRVDYFYLEFDLKVLSLVAILVHQEDSFFNVFFMIFHEMLESELFGEVEHQGDFLLVVVIISNADVFVVLSDLVQQVEIEFSFVHFLVFLHFVQQILIEDVSFVQ